MIKIVALFGAAGSGKDTLQNLVTECLDVNPLVSITTRPPRGGEIEGDAYHFVAEEDFMNEPMLEYTTFRGWYYGTPYSAIDKHKLNIGVFNISGIKQMMQYSKIIKILPIYIKCEDRVRLERQLSREEYPDCEEICRRYLTDKKDFKEENITFDYHWIDNSEDLGDTLENLVSTIAEWDKTLDDK